MPGHVQLVVGLGNPGPEYAQHRHNLGARVVDELRGAWGLPAFASKYRSLFSRGEVDGAPVALLLPQTYMNLSGEAVQPAAALLKVPPAEILVVHDELDLPWGDVRLKIGGGHAGHNGLRSILQQLGSADFVRLRVGVGRPPPDFRGDVAAWVLSGLDASQRAELPGVVERALDAIRRVAADGVDAAMKAVHSRRDSTPPAPRLAGKAGGA